MKKLRILFSGLCLLASIGQVQAVVLSELVKGSSKTETITTKTYQEKYEVTWVCANAKDRIGYKELGRICGVTQVSDNAPQEYKNAVGVYGTSMLLNEEGSIDYMTQNEALNKAKDYKLSLPSTCADVNCELQEGVYRKGFLFIFRELLGATPVVDSLALLSFDVRWLENESVPSFQTQFAKLFPADWSDGFWSSSVLPDLDYYAFHFYGYYGYVYYYDRYYDLDNGVRLVGR